MNELINTSVHFGVTLSILAYGIGLFLKHTLKFSMINPLLVSILITVAFRVTTNTKYEVYNNSAQYLSYLLTPATVCLAIPFYEQLEILKKNYLAVFAGILSGVLTSSAASW